MKESTFFKILIKDEKVTCFHFLLTLLSYKGGVTQDKLHQQFLVQEGCMKNQTPCNIIPIIVIAHLLNMHHVASF